MFVHILAAKILAWQVRAHLGGEDVFGAQGGVEETCFNATPKADVRAFHQPAACHEHKMEIGNIAQTSEQEPMVRLVTLRACSISSSRKQRRKLRLCSCWFSIGNERMSFISHPVWFPLRGPLDSFQRTCESFWRAFELAGMLQRDSATGYYVRTDSWLGICRAALERKAIGWIVAASQRQVPYDF